MLFNLNIEVYTYNGNNLYKYFYFENIEKNSELMIIHYVNKNHFELIYGIQYNLDNNHV